MGFRLRSCRRAGPRQAAQSGGGFAKRSTPLHRGSGSPRSSRVCGTVTGAGPDPEGLHAGGHGEYDRAVEALLQAEPLIKEDSRLMNILRLNLAWDFCHLGRFAEADAIGRQVRAVAAEMGDEIGILRGLWLAGRIAAGMGRSEEAR